MHLSRRKCPKIGVFRDCVMYLPKLHKRVRLPLPAPSERPDFITKSGLFLLSPKRMTAM